MDTMFTVSYIYPINSKLTLVQQAVKRRCQNELKERKRKRSIQEKSGSEAFPPLTKLILMPDTKQIHQGKCQLWYPVSKF